jgi:hypothetical protein
LTTFKNRKEEFYKRDDAVQGSLYKLDKLQEKLEELSTKKKWITEE